MTVRKKNINNYRKLIQKAIDSNKVHNSHFFNFVPDLNIKIFNKLKYY